MEYSGYENKGKEGESSSKYYQCSVCKGGFSSAQALGGHMNMHRKERDSSRSNRPNRSSNSTSHAPSRPSQTEFTLSYPNQYTHSASASTWWSERTRDNQEVDLELRLGPDQYR